MKIALDWDDTFTRDPELWVWFIELCLTQGHDIRIVTMRSADQLDDVRSTLVAKGCDLDELPIIPTDREQKRAYCAQNDFFPDVWIDDTPEFIV